MPTVWSAEQVLALAPDTGSAAAGRKLSSPTPWSDAGTADEPAAVWGLCKGSGSTPYQCVVDLAGPAYRCSCPSRKFPCKHVLGLLLLWSAGRVPPAEPPDWAGSWLADRQDRAARAAQRSEAPERSAPADPEAAARRARQRAERVAAGIDELDAWLTDQVRNGLAELERAGYVPFDRIAARMVDAQIPGVAGRLRGLRGVVAAGEGWPSRLLEQLAALRLTVAAYRRLDRLPEGLAACVRRELGEPVAREDVLGTPALRDHWRVLGLRDTAEDRLTTRRVWLHGEKTGRPALVLSFAAAGQPLEASLVPGTVLDADLHFYPGTAPLRALVGARHAEPEQAGSWSGGTLTDAAGAFAAAVAADPWTTSWPVLLAGATVVPGESRWSALDGNGRSIPLVAAPDARWRLLAVSGGRPVPLAAEYTADGLRPLSVLDGDRLVLL